MSSSTIAIVDYGAGNLTSVAYALRHLGREPHITRDPGDILAAERVIFPGVGAAGACMDNLRRLRLDHALREVVSEGRPLLGICVGCQVIFDHSEEDGGTDCLGILAGRVKLFQFPSGVTRKVPHMGWNRVERAAEHHLFKDIPDGSHFYFVHSYHPEPTDSSVILGSTVYGGVQFASAVLKGSLAAVQFHTEKSGEVGLRFLENFLEWDPACVTSSRDTTTC